MTSYPLLDTISNPAQLRALDRKQFYVSLLGLERAREFADELGKQALDSLAIFGERGQRLIELTEFITHRKVLADESGLILFLPEIAVHAG